METEQERNSTLPGIGLKKIPLKFSSRPCRAIADARISRADASAPVAKPRRKCFQATLPAVTSSRARARNFDIITNGKHSRNEWTF